MDTLPSTIMFAYMLVCSLRASLAVDFIAVSQSLSDDGTTLLSQGGIFELGFFSPGNSSKRYLGIWYKKVQMYTVVWVANRANPINDTSGILTLDTTGNLILSQSTSVVWQTNSQKRAQSTVAQLMDSGNLVVRNEGDANSQDFLWQSFDYPSDTILPGMKLGWDLRRGLEWRITSWKSPNDPSPGDLSFGLALNSYPDFYMKENGTLSRFGPWNGLYFSGEPHLKTNPYFEFSYVTNNDAKYSSNKDEVYYIFFVKNSSVFSRVVLNQTTTQITHYVWLEGVWVVYLSFVRDQCDVYRTCGANGNCNIEVSPQCQCLEGFRPKSPRAWDSQDWTEGCIRKKPLTCNDTFVKFTGLKVPDTTNTWLDENMGLEECRVVCLKNCSCMAYSNSDIRGAGSGCVNWFGDLTDIKQYDNKIFNTSGQDLYIRMAASELSENNIHAEPQTRSKKKNTRTIVAATIPATCGVLLLCIYLIYRVQRRNTIAKSMTENNIKRHVEEMDLPLFDLPKITTATNNFWMENKIGQGGFGPVYKGKLVDGQEIAVKRLSRSSGQGMTEFINEVKLIAKLQHRNLVRLLGCCIHGEEKLLIYEYMANGSLDSFIFDHIKGKLLNWPHRFHIIFGIARGLLYLHQDSRLRIIHRDLKASNVLLDGKMNPKISDFGMAKAFGGDQTEGNTNRVVGTYGYMAPEYAINGLFSIKSDVFSFGILLLEIISGLKNRSLNHANNTYDLVGYAWTLWKEGNALQLIDANIKESSIDSEVLRCIHVSLICVQQYPEDRPTMTSVLRMLESEMDLVDPKEPAFFPRKDSNEVNFILDHNGMNSYNGLTMTSLNGR